VPGTEEELEESLLLAPMLSDDQVLGVVVLAKLGLDRFTPGDLRYLALYASVAAQAMINADIPMRLRAQERTLDRQLRGQAELLRVTERILTTLDPAGVIAEIADSLAGLIPLDSLGVYVHQPGARTLEPLLARGMGAESFMARRLPDSGAVVSQVLSGGEARSVVRRARGPRDEPAALILAPQRGPERVIGNLYAKRLGVEAHFEQREFDLVRLFAAHVSIALQNALAHQAVELRAQTDALTGLRNHGTFRDDLRAAVAAGRPFALLMLDLDDFKSYNDRHGHEAGNILLRGIAGAISSACRETDRVYRYGGDEFCLILPGAGERDAIEVGERLQGAIRTVEGGRRRSDGMRCSVGIATFPHDAAERAELLLAADRALYAAKRAGRDRVGTAADGRTLAGELVPPHTPLEPVPSVESVEQVGRALPPLAI
jgi:diguanylate cyclase (GGDEF)-like protein